MTLKLEVGKRYVRRDGAVSGPIVASNSEDYPFHVLFEGESVTVLYKADGSYGNNGIHEEDIISEYIETAVPQESRAISTTPQETPEETEFQQLSRIVEIFDGMSDNSKRDVLAFLNSRFGINF